MAMYQGKVGHGGSQIIEAVTPRKGGMKPQSRKGGDLRAGKGGRESAGKQQ
ncbi:MAG: hypothetical protein IJC43_09085 [Clostridia bacterium]|nr:hypothetical protein [Clostridia bacterium]